MAFQFAPPDKFDFAQPAEWTKWIQRFERFREASELSKKPETLQISTLIYCMGTTAEDIFKSFVLSAEDQQKYSAVKGKFDSHFVGKRNIIFERAQFNRRQQREGESADDFITALYGLAENCNYGTLRDEMLRDRIVVGIRDIKLSENLQMDPNLKLEDAVNKVRHNEAIKQQQMLLHSINEEGSPSNIDAVRSKSNYRKKGSKPGLHRGNPPNQGKQNMCLRCGKTPGHSRDNCPAKAQTCNKCGKVGHFSRVCRTKDVKRVEAKQPTLNEENLLAEAFLGTINSDKEKQNKWKANIEIGGANIYFKLDTGAEVTVISKQMYDSLPNANALGKPTKVLYGVGHQPLGVLGSFSCTLQHKNKLTTEEIFVIPTLTEALLSINAIEGLHLATRVAGIAGHADFRAEFPRLFQGLGKMENEFDIKLKPGIKPFNLSTPRRIPLPLMDKVKEELANMEACGVISKVDKPTEWCAGIVVVPKSNGRVRICVDLTKLNESVCREKHPLPAVDQTLALLKGAKVFSKLDANSGFWQIPLTPKSAPLTTFITPFGRYFFNRLPFGISSAPEHFQKRMSAVLEGAEGVVCLMDDVLVYGRSTQEHDSRLRIVLSKLQAANVTLNDKCEFSKTSIKFLGHTIDENGIHPDLEKIQGIRNMEEPENVSEVRSFLGMTNQLGKFLPNLAERTKPLRDLLKKENQWLWGEEQSRAFSEIKQELSSMSFLAHYSPKSETMVSADASSYGLGAVIRQKQENGEWRPVAYASRSMTPTEQRYAQIEKEALATTWACEKFSDYLIGLLFHIETDHKPLISLFSKKDLSDLPPRIQRFRMRLMRYTFTISHVPGKELCTADTLSRSPSKYTPNKGEEIFHDEVERFVYSIVSQLPMTDETLKQIQKCQWEDKTYQEVKIHCTKGWPEKPKLSYEVKLYQAIAGELTVHDDLLMRGNRLVIPYPMRKTVLERIHQGHQGISKC